MDRTQLVKDYLDKNFIKYTPITFAHETKSAKDAALVLNCDVSQIVKSLIFRSNKYKQFYLFLFSGSKRVDIEKFNSVNDDEIIPATSEEIVKHFGFIPGGVPPVGYEIDKVFIDESLLKLSEVWGSLGSINSVFKIAITDLIYIYAGKGKILTEEMKLKEISKIVVGLLEINSTLLILKRSKNRHEFPGSWEFISGFIEEGEQPKYAMIRESLEETNVAVKISKAGDAVITNDYKVWIAYPFILKAEEIIKIKISEEHDEYKFVPIESCLEILKLPGTDLILKELFN